MEALGPSGEVLASPFRAVVAVQPEALEPRKVVVEAAVRPRGARLTNLGT